MCFVVHCYTVVSHVCARGYVRITLYWQDVNKVTHALPSYISTESCRINMALLLTAV